MFHLRNGKFSHVRKYAEQKFDFKAAYRDPSIKMMRSSHALTIAHGSGHHVINPNIGGTDVQNNW
jgi:hypothetical protein